MWETICLAANSGPQFGALCTLFPASLYHSVCFGEPSQGSEHPHTPFLDVLETSVLLLFFLISWLWHNKKYMLGVYSQFHSWQRVPKSLGISRVIGTSFFNEETFAGPLDGFRMGAGHQNDQTLIRRLVLSFPSPISWKRRWVGNWVNNWSHVYDEASIKNP